MAMHTPGKSDAGTLGSTKNTQNPLKDSIMKQPARTGKLDAVKRNFNPSSPKPVGSNKFKGSK